MKKTLKPKTKNLKLNHGFTLFEMLIVLAIITIAATFVTINYVNHSYQDIISTTQEIVAVMRNAQDNSISQESGNQWGVHFENPASGDDFYELFSGASYSDGLVISKKVLPTDIYFTTPSSDDLSVDIIFSKITGLPLSDQSITLSSTDNKYSVVIIAYGLSGKIDYQITKN